MGLTNKQRSMLDRFIEKYKDEISVSFLISYNCNKDMLRDIDAIINIKSTDSILSDIQRYIDDKIMAR